MRTNTRFLWLLMLLSVCLCLTMMACTDSEGEGTTAADTAIEASSEPATATPTEEITDTPTEAVTEATTGEATEATTAASTDETAEAVTEAPAEDTAEESAEETAEATSDAFAETTAEETTEEATEPAAPTLMTAIDFSGMDAGNLSAYVTRLSKCEVTVVEDGDEGQVIRLTTKGIASVGTDRPHLLLKLSDLVGDMGGIMPDTVAYPHVVLKVRAGDLWSRTFSYFGGESVRVAASYEGNTRTTRVANTDGWQYIYLDLTSYTTSWEIFYFAFEQAAAKNGEYMDLAEMHFFATAEEAEALCPAMTDTYPIVEQTLNDYTLKVMSFNVQTENGTQVNFDLRAEMLRDLLDELQPDSIGMQEVTTGWIYRMDTFAFNNSYAGVGEGRTPGGEASSIYYRKDKLELVGSGTFWLSETPDVMGSSLPNANYPRICTWAHLRDKATGFEYIHVNTHLDHNGNNSSSDGKSIRTTQVRVMLEYLQKLPDVPMVLTGDFNQAKTTSEDVNYAMFKNILGESTFTSSTGEKITGNFSEARADAADTVSPDAWASMTKYWDEGSTSYNPAKKPIDYVFYTTEDFDAMVYRNIHYHRDGVYMSDHLPQYCELHVKVVAE